MSISLINSTVDQTRFRNGITGLLMSEMANSAGPSPYPSVYAGPSPTPVPIGPQGPPFGMPIPQQPVIVVQPPAQQIYFNAPPFSNDHSYSYDTSRPERSPSKFEFIFKSTHRISKETKQILDEINMFRKNQHIATKSKETVIHIERFGLFLVRSSSVSKRNSC